MAISRRHEIPQQPILFYEVFNVWGIDFMRPFPISNGYSYILLAIDYVSRWVEAIATKTNDAKVVVDFLKSNIICRFGESKALISDQDSEEGVSSRHSKWDGPFVITHIFPYGVVELKEENTNSTFQVNGQQIKLFHEGPKPTMAEMESISLMEPALPDDSPLATFGIPSVFMPCTIQPKPKNHDQPQPLGSKELWNCFGNGSRSSVGETPGDIARMVYPKQSGYKSKERNRSKRLRVVAKMQQNATKYKK
ncbi:hypothetical protein CR513_31831, partial [Mucuna pruriens]